MRPGLRYTSRIAVVVIVERRRGAMDLRLKNWPDMPLQCTKSSQSVWADRLHHSSARRREPWIRRCPGRRSTGDGHDGDQQQCETARRAGGTASSHAFRRRDIGTRPRNNDACPRIDRDGSQHAPGRHSGARRWRSRGALRDSAWRAHRAAPWNVRHVRGRDRARRLTFRQHNGLRRHKYPESVCRGVAVLDLDSDGGPTCCFVDGRDCRPTAAAPATAVPKQSHCNLHGVLAGMRTRAVIFTARPQPCHYVTTP